MASCLDLIIRGLTDIQTRLNSLDCSSDTTVNVDLSPVVTAIENLQNDLDIRLSSLETTVSGMLNVCDEPAQRVDITLVDGSALAVGNPVNFQVTLLHSDPSFSIADVSTNNGTVTTFHNINDLDYYVDVTPVSAGACDLTATSRAVSDTLSVMVA